VQIYEIFIKPKSAFATSLKGDTIFGSLCWHIENLGFDLTNFLKDYDKNPFMVISSSFWKSKDKQNYIFKKPDAPDFLLFGDQASEKRKENNRKDFFIHKIGEELKPLASNLKTQEEIFSDIRESDGKSFISHKNIMHASINRNTFATDQEGFAPFSMEVEFYSENITPIVFVAIDEKRFDKDKLLRVFENLGKVGFGKKASIGYGHFDILTCDESLLFKNLPIENFEYLYTLSPLVPADNESIKYCQPFTRFGKHGDILAIKGNPFKKPIIMADEGALLKIDNYNPSSPIAGKSINKISDNDPRTVSQGYSLYLPISLHGMEVLNV
jgi:CRISPR-associated protein Csm4